MFVFDGFADWEPASALAELRRSFGFATRAVALSKEPVVSMGGLHVTPEDTLAEMETPDILILPGGDSWMAAERPGITAAVRRLANANKPVAAICAATLALAHAGLLDHRLHTSNGAGFIEKFVPSYRGATSYRTAPAITDQGVITASGVAPIAFAAAIFRAMAPERERDIAMYEGLYARGLID